jgi:flagellar secretion chaperone FliS
MKLSGQHQTYKQMDTQCSEAQLVLMLIDGAIRFTRQGADFLRGQKWAEKGQAVDSALECINQLRQGLNHGADDDMVKTLDRMYDFLATKLSCGNAARDVKQFEEVIASLQSLRSAWQELFERLRREGKLASTAAANIRL